MIEESGEAVRFGPPALELGEQGLNAFIVARGLLERGTLGQDGTAPAAIAAVILYDVAVETAAKAALRVKAPVAFPGAGYAIQAAKRTQQRKEYLPWVLDQLLAVYRDLEGNEQAEWQALREARALHDYRNLVQHQGTIPSTQDVDRQRFRATDFIISLTRSFFGRELSEISRAILVQDAEVRTFLQEAERRLAGGDLQSASEKLAIAFEVARQSFRSGQPFDFRKAINDFDVRRAISELKGDLHSAANRRGRYPSMQRLERLLEALVRRSDRVEDRLEALSLGAQPSDYVWFRNRFPRADGPFGGVNWEVSWPERSRRPFTPEEVARGMDFVTTVALHWQQFPSPGPEDEE